jgi:hypothetical protein
MKVTIKQSQLSCVRKDAEGEVVGPMPGGWAIRVPYFLTGLFGGQVDGTGIFFFEHNEVAIIPATSGTPVEGPLVNESI